MERATERDLKLEIGDMRERFPNLQDSELFVAWFLKSFVTENENESDAIGSLVGGPGDKSLDAIFVDDTAKKVFIVQGKYRQHFGKTAEHRSDIITFAELAGTFAKSEAFSSFLTDLDAAAAGKANEAHKRIRGRKYSLQLYYVTTGRCSASLMSEAARIVRQAELDAAIEIIDGKEGASPPLRLPRRGPPPVPMLELEIESGNGIGIGGILQRYDSETGIESWGFPVRVRNIAQMYDQAGIRLFARNVRGFLGETAVNRNMENTLQKEPEFSGITTTGSRSSATKPNNSARAVASWCA